MRTSLTIDDHLMRELKAYAHQQGLPLKRVMNLALRTGLESLRKPAGRRRYRLKTFSLGNPPGVSLEKAQALAGALEDEERARKLALRK